MPPEVAYQSVADSDMNIHRSVGTLQNTYESSVRRGKRQAA
jgi:hypothetical protein